jgi:Uma2 family endonuclease
MATISFSAAGFPQSIELPLRQFDADEFIVMAEAGALDARRRVELIGGYVVDMSPANSDHGYVISRFNELFAPLMGQFKIWIQSTLKVDHRNVFDPDFMLLRLREHSYKLTLPTSEDVALLVEVAGSSLPRDTGVKLPIYAKHGVADFWIADLDREVIVVHREPGGESYGNVQELSGDESIAPLAAPAYGVKVRDLFT